MAVPQHVSPSGLVGGEELVQGWSIVKPHLLVLEGEKPLGRGAHIPL